MSSAAEIQNTPFKPTCSKPPTAQPVQSIHLLCCLRIRVYLGLNDWVTRRPYAAATMSTVLFLSIF